MTTIVISSLWRVGIQKNHLIETVEFFWVRTTYVLNDI